MVRSVGHPNAQADGAIFEHVLVMSQILGRPLVEGENVHHRNGLRHDNRPVNLELWVTRQPSGQRPEDLIAWAREILERYDGDRSWDTKFYGEDAEALGLPLVGAE